MVSLPSSNKNKCHSVPVQEGDRGKNILIPPVSNPNLSYYHVEKHAQPKAPSLKDVHGKLFSL